MAFFDQYASRLTQAAIDHLSDGIGTYHPGEGGDVVGVPYQLNLSYETVDEQGFVVSVTALTLPKSRVGDVDRDDDFTAGERRWRYSRLLDDDGEFVTFRVT